MEAVKNFWADASPNAKRIVMGSAAIAVFVAFGSVVAIMDRSRDRPKPVKTETNTSVMLPQKRNTDLESVSGTMLGIERRLRQIEVERTTTTAGTLDQLKQIREEINTTVKGDETKKQVDLLSSRLDALSKKVEVNGMSAERAAPSHTKPMPPLDKVLPPPLLGGKDARPEVPANANADANAELKAAAPVEKKLRIIGEDDDIGDGDGKAATPASKDAKGAPAKKNAAMPSTAQAPKEQMTWLPMGSMIRGVLLNGLDAPTSGTAQKNPTPVLVRIKHDAILPNRASMDIRECFVLMSGFGSISQERALLRSEMLSCVLEDGGVIEAKLDGYAVGEDGKVGMRGKVVSKQGAQLARALVSGVFAGLGKGLQPQSIMGLNLSPTARLQQQTPDFANVMEGGMLSGASTSLNMVSKFYLDQAKEMLPVVEIDSGRQVTIILVHGTGLKLASK